MSITKEQRAELRVTAIHCERFHQHGDICDFAKKSRAEILSLLDAMDKADEKIEELEEGLRISRGQESLLRIEADELATSLNALQNSVCMDYDESMTAIHRGVPVRGFSPQKIGMLRMLKKRAEDALRIMKCRETAFGWQRPCLCICEYNEAHQGCGCAQRHCEHCACKGTSWILIKAAVVATVCLDTDVVTPACDGVPAKLFGAEINLHDGCCNAPTANPSVGQDAVAHLKKLSERVRIWSIEHKAWWRPDSKGYTTDISQAGLYSPEEANDIVGKSSKDEVVIRQSSAVPKCVDELISAAIRIDGKVVLLDLIDAVICYYDGDSSGKSVTELECALAEQTAIAAKEKARADEVDVDKSRATAALLFLGYVLDNNRMWSTVCNVCGGRGWISQAGHGCNGSEEDCQRTCPVEEQGHCMNCCDTGLIPLDIPIPSMFEQMSLEVRTTADTDPNGPGRTIEDIKAMCPQTVEGEKS